MTAESPPGVGELEQTTVASAIERQEDPNRQLATELAEAQARPPELSTELAEAPHAPVRPCRVAAVLPRSAAEKVNLFRQLFRGRDDVYPTRFVSKKTGKPGYAPACSNKFVRGICDLPKVKCSDCPNQAFRPVDDAAFLQHLRGKHVMGVYPMLTDETCWFLAADFDKGTWKDDVRAFMETTRQRSGEQSLGELGDVSTTVTYLRADSLNAA